MVTNDAASGIDVNVKSHITLVDSLIFQSRYTSLVKGCFENVTSFFIGSTLNSVFS